MHQASLRPSRSPSTGFRALGLKVWGSRKWVHTWAVTHGRELGHHRVRGYSKGKERKKEKKKIHWPVPPRKNGRKHKYTRHLLIGIGKKIKYFSHFYGNIGKPQWNEQFLRKTKCIQVTPSRNRKLLSIPIEEIGKFSRP